MSPRILTLLPLAAVLTIPTSGQTMPEHEHAKAPQSTSLTLTVDGHSTTLTLADLQAVPQKTITVHNEHTKTDETYSGVVLSDLLAKYGAPFDRASEKKSSTATFASKALTTTTWSIPLPKSKAQFTTPTSL